jgi:hypothetical protein
MIKKHKHHYYITSENGGLFDDGFTRWFDSFDKAKECLIEQEETKLQNLKYQINKINDKIKEIKNLKEK